MRNSVSIRCMIASDAACIVGGFIAAIIFVLLVQGWSSSRLVEEFLQAQRPAANVSPVVKSDRADSATFEARFGRRLWDTGEDGAGRIDDRSGRLRFWLDPASATTIPTGLGPTDKPASPRGTPSSEGNDGSKVGPSPLKTLGCDPLASPLVDPALARFAGRCLAWFEVASRATV